MTAELRDSLAQVQELKPCPFCGGKAVAENYVIEAAVFCAGCRAKIIRSHGARDDNGYPEAITAWNNRHGDADRSAELTTAWMAGAESVRERDARDAEDAARWRAWRELDEHAAADIAWRNAGAERDAAIDAARAGERG